MFVEVGKRVSVEELLKGIIIQSGNDASVAIAEHLAGTEAVFASMMNEQARDLE
jgi:serine-type D-Ala-D-Ala carboxypeptidase (penicillin-binding protein 5/6)